MERQEGGLHLERVAYSPPTWASRLLAAPPRERVRLGNFPTPIHRWSVAPLEALGLRCFVKRDDATGFDISGNKSRKLEFLLADALAKRATAIVTIGGIQSNHCRATAVAARQLGIEPRLILRTTESTSQDPGLLGNLGYERLVGSTVHLVSKSEYQRVGSGQLLADYTATLPGRPYAVPVGGSNALGTWGYLEMISELEAQVKARGKPFPDHIVLACGSGGTAAGIAIGVRLAGHRTVVTAIGVCDTPQIFYDHIRDTAAELGVSTAEFGEPESWLRIYDGQGVGYAQSTPDELRFIAQTAATTGVVLDPVYSGKGLYGFTKVAAANPGVYRRGQTVLFIHTGGGMALSSRTAELVQANVVPGGTAPLPRHSSKL